MKRILAVIMVLVSWTSLRAGDIDGLWKETSTPGHKNSFVVIAQDGDTVHVACYWESGSNPVVWYATGKRTGNNITWEVTHTVAPRDWDPRGTHAVTVAPDGKKMTGTWRNTRGQSGPLVFVKVKPQGR